MSKPEVVETIDERLKKMLASGEWKKELTWSFYKIKEDNQGIKHIYVHEVDFYIEPDFMCKSCGTSKYRLFKADSVSGGVFVTCIWCGYTNGPISEDFGIQRKDYEISPAEAFKIMKARRVKQRELMVWRKLIDPRTTKSLKRKRPRPRK